VSEQLWQTAPAIFSMNRIMRIPVFDPLPATSVAETGTALVCHERLREVLDREESATLRWLANLPGRHILELGPPMQGYVLKVTHARTAASYDGGARHLSLRVTVAAEAYMSPTMELKSDLVKVLAQSAAETITRRIVALVHRLQATDADAPMWYEVAQQAGYFDFDLKRTTVTAQVKVNILPVFGASP
jgi:hypothetical protein